MPLFHDPQEKIDSIHEQVIRGDIRSVSGLLEKKGWANARDHYGHSPMHKCVMANQEDILKFLLNHHPDHVEDKDNVSNILIRSGAFEVISVFCPKKFPGNQCKWNSGNIELLAEIPRVMRIFLFKFLGVLTEIVEL